MNSLLKIGNIIKHYKGNYYQILGFATHTETLEDLILYASYDIETKETWKVRVWARPKHMFNDDVLDPETGNKIKRFTLIEGK